MDNSTGKRLAKNTFFLYIRMFVIMGVTLYTTRVVLNILGIDDYGIYDTIAGVVVLFSFINNAMVTTTQRFLNFYIGKGEDSIVSSCFSMSLIVHFLIAVIMALSAELIGLYFLYYKMSLPLERFNAAFWTLQLSIVITFVNVMRSPYNACIIAYEKMDFYAYISIIEALLKLSVAYVLSIVFFDKLILYSVLLLVVAIIIMLAYKIYCNKKYEISHFRYKWDKHFFFEMFNFSGFSLMGNAANMGAQQGLSMIVNVFNGVAVNAAIAIGNQLSHGVYNFISSFQVAFNPIIVKTYAKNDFDDLKNLIYSVSKYSFYLMFLISLPLFFYCENYLNLWLVHVPNYATEFCQLIILTLLVDTIAEPLWKTVQASGNIRKYQIITSLLILSNLPISIIILELGLSPVFVFVGKFIVNIGAYCYRFFFVRKLINIPLRTYIKKTVAPILVVSIVLTFMGIIIKTIDFHYIVSSILLVLIAVFVVFSLGLSSFEKRTVVSLVKNKLSH